MLTLRIQSVLAALLLGRRTSFVQSRLDSADTDEWVVSAIVNREIEARVIAHRWPSTPQSVFCEAFAYHGSFGRGEDFLNGLVDTAAAAGRDEEGEDGKHPDSFFSPVTYEEALQYSLKASPLIGTTQRRLFEATLALRAHSPHCEMHRMLARETLLQVAPSILQCQPGTLNAFAVVHGRVVEQSLLPYYDFASITTASTNEPYLIPDEEILGPVETNTTTLTSQAVILYANLGTPIFRTTYRRLRAMNVPFVVRHLGAVNFEDGLVPEATSTVLQGYGVRLDIRNVEYKVFDDRTAGLTQDGGDDDNGLIDLRDEMLDTPNQFLAGINLTALNLNVDTTDLRTNLWQLHNRQDSQASIIPPVWRRRQMPLQAAAAIVASSDPLITLQQISQDLPSLASTLVHHPVPESVREAADFLQGQKLRPGMIFFNGRAYALDLPSFNVFEFFALLREEQMLLERMKETFGPLLPSQAALNDLHRAWMSGHAFLRDNEEDDGENDPDAEDKMETSDERPIRIDVARGWQKAVIYVNDVEKDSQYSSWPRSMQHMLMSLQMGGPPTVRRNMFTLLAVLDPMGDSLGNSAFNLAMQLMQSRYPARLGILIFDQGDLEKCVSFLSSSTNNEGPCPVPPRGDAKTIFKKPDQVTVTSQFIHQLIIMAQRDMAKYPMAFLRYVEQLLFAIEEVRASGKPFSLQDLVQKHGALYGELQISNSQDSRSSALKSLSKVSPEDSLAYGHTLRFAVEKGLKPGMGFLNGRPLPLDATDESVGTVFGQEHNHVLGLVVQGKITDASPRSIYGFLVSGDRVYKKFHPLLLESSSDTIGFLQLQDEFPQSSVMLPSVKDTATASKVDATFLIDGLFDLSTSKGVMLAGQFVQTMMFFPSKALIGEDNIALSFRILPSTASAGQAALCRVLAHASLINLESLQLLLGGWKASMNLDQLLRMIPKLSMAAKDAIKSEITEQACAHQPYFAQDMPSSNVVLANGRVLNVDEVGSITRDDIEILLTVEMKRAKAVANLLAPHTTMKRFSDTKMASRIAAFLAMELEPSKPNRRGFHPLLSKLRNEAKNSSSLLLSWNEDTMDGDVLKVHAIAVLDPVSEAAQRAANFLLLVRDYLELPLSVLLVPPPVLQGDSSLPITSYYRFVMDPTGILHDTDLKASFSNLPAVHVLTVQPDVPEPWNVQQTSARQDTDNLRCDPRSGCGDSAMDVSQSSGDSADKWSARAHLTKVEYGLKSLLVFGQCFEAKGSPPNGLQLTLVRETNLNLKVDPSHGIRVDADGTISDMDSKTPYSADERLEYTDTLVMKNVGYWQLRSNPGVWKLSIAEDSKGANMFDMIDGIAQGGRLKIIPSKESQNVTKTVILKDFLNRGELLVLKRRAGFERASLFYDNDQSKTTAPKGIDDDTINVFSLATGHLYERFLKIMMLSVSKRTSTKVKFWLFENFLSPTFKASAQAMAERVGFEVAFVTYKWPQWLRAQKEKQRIIWGYKILFLDVLFPLGVKKIIYVDADQVVRGDLKELWDMDLQGAPYAYTPFCTSRHETLGYQFWRDGFWKSHLRGKPYHISALYVVDLDRFRRTLVGDSLRSVYQQLSADPNSLANLDQDLPNYAQHNVPIFSLPQEWLWCESWCSDESKSTAKTIDLCNNPMHKEPKVSMAKRIISGPLFNESWVELDAEVERYEQEFLRSQIAGCKS